MEEKKAKIRNSIWSVPGLGIFNKLLFRSKYSNSPLPAFLKPRGFTLIELIVVMGMIVTLTTVLIVLINPGFQIKRANDGRRKADLKQIQSGLEIYRADVGGYPIDSAADGSVNATQNSGTSLINGTVTYIQSVPKDPKTAVNYYYCTQAACGAAVDCATAPCSSYAVFSCIENANDPDGLASGSVPAAVVTGLACPTGTTKYFKVINP